MNPIEHMWSRLKAAVQRRNPTSRDDMIRAAKKEWRELVNDGVTIPGLYNSMERRMMEVRVRKGAFTRY